MERQAPARERKRRLRPAIATAIAFALTDPASALDPQKTISQFTHTSWSAKDGIPGPVRAIAQTPDGYLWLGTEAGLYRFDGIRFVLFEPGEGAKLAGSSVWSLRTARDGGLWIGFGSGGISHFHGGRLKSYSPADGAPAGGVLSIVEDGSGSIWAGGQYGFSKFERGRWRRVGKDIGYPAPGAQSLLVDRQGTLWVATDGLNFGLSKDPVQRNTILTLAENAKSFVPTGEAVGMVWSMTQAPDRHVWIADTSGRRVRQIGDRNGSNTEIPTGGEPLCLGFDNPKSVWIGLIEDGVRRLPDVGRAQPSGLDRFQPADGLSGGLVYSSLKDREGNLWFGTGGGLDRFRENKVTNFSVREGLDPDQQIALTSTPDGSVWIVSYTRDAVRRFRQGRISSSKLPPHSPSDSTRILSIYGDRKGRVWVGGNFKVARESDGQFSYVARELEEGSNVEAIAEDAAGNLWITVTEWPGASREPTTAERVLRLRDGEWTVFGSTAGLPDYRSRVLHGDARGRMWLGFENGEVAVYENERFHVYSAKDGLPGGRVLAITSDRSGRLWVGGEGGLSRFDGARFQTLTSENGLLGNSISGIVEDDEGFLWLAGGLGILRVKPQELERALASPSDRIQGMSFDASDGLRGLPRQREPFPSAARSADGRLWFATTGGISVIDPRKLPRNLVPPPVAIEEVNADDQSFPASPGLRLRPNTRNLAFRYAALSLTDPDRVQFRYKLEGYDGDWRGTVNAREATYTNLPPGAYRFRVIASNNDGVWNQEGASVEFRITPAFYQTTWFLLLGAGLAMILAWTIHKARVRNMTARLDQQFRDRLSERTRIAQDLHDTLLQGFLSASIQLHVVDDQLPGDSPAKPRLSRVLQLMTNVSEEARNTLRGLRSPEHGGSLDLEEAFSRIRQELAIPDDVAFRVAVEGRPRPLRPIARDEVYRIGREALVNAFRHARANHIEVEVEYVAKQLRVIVRDDGRGIDSDVLRAGREDHFGLLGMRERAERIGSKLRVMSRDGLGTEIELSVPAPVAFEAPTAGRPTRWFDAWFRRSAAADAPETGKQGQP